MQVQVRYVSGRRIDSPPVGWPELPAEGLDEVAVASDVGMTRLSGQSVYWLYREGKAWVMGGGPVGYGQLPPEVVVLPDGRHVARPIDYMPDLAHSVVKLGHWWPGTEGAPR